MHIALVKHIVVMSIAQALDSLWSYFPSVLTDKQLAKEFARQLKILVEHRHPITPYKLRYRLRTYASGIRAYIRVVDTQQKTVFKRVVNLRYAIEKAQLRVYN